MIFKLTCSYNSDIVIYLFVFTFTDSLGRCGSNEDGKTQEEDLELLVEKRENVSDIFYPAEVTEKQNEMGIGMVTLLI